MKRILYFLGTTTLALGVFLTTKNISLAENTDMQSLSAINSVNAECTQQGDMRDSGHCYELTQNCYWGTVDYMKACDPWAM